jgi:hypothetical protein
LASRQRHIALSLLTFSIPHEARTIAGAGAPRTWLSKDGAKGRARKSLPGAGLIFAGSAGGHRRRHFTYVTVFTSFLSRR